MASHLADPLFMGIDPGQGGGIAFIVDDAIGAVPTPATERDLLDYLTNCKALTDGPAHAVLEKVHSSPQMGVSSAFKFGADCGRLRMALVAAGIPFDEVTPQRWQKQLGCLSGGEKNITKARAQALFPALKITHALADALLLAEYCRRIRTGQLQADVQTIIRTKKTRFEAKRPALF